jgi:L-seryl-tRNA(Ser) seleniumtransferase
VFAALEATLRVYAEGRARDAIPVIRMLSEPAEQVRERAQRLASLVADRVANAGTHASVRVAIESSEARVGGGAMPSARIPSWALVIEAAGEAGAVTLERALRQRADPPIVARVRGGRVWLDARTIADDETEAAARGLARALAEIQEVYAGGDRTAASGKDHDVAGDDGALDEEG